MILRRARLLSEMRLGILALDDAALVGVAADGGAVAAVVGRGDVVVVAGQLLVRQLRLQQSCGRGGLPRLLWAGHHWLRRRGSQPSGVFLVIPALVAGRTMMSQDHNSCKKEKLQVNNRKLVK
jgi:hypothetical protein